jgi:hypothetical protein
MEVSWSGMAFTCNSIKKMMMIGKLKLMGGHRFEAATREMLFDDEENYTISIKLLWEIIFLDN